MAHTFALCAPVLVGGLSLSAVNLAVHEGRPVVDGVYLNGHGPYRFLVDTGTNISLVEARLAESIGLTPSYRMQLVSSVGGTLANGADDLEIGLDSVRAVGQKALFIDLTGIRRVLPDVQGVLGQYFLSGFDYLLDLRAKRLEFGQRVRSGTRAEFAWSNGRPAIVTSLGPLILDSGAAQIILFGKETSGTVRELHTVSGTRQVGSVTVQLRIKGRTVWRGDAVAVARSEQTEDGAAGLLPARLFHSIYVCNSEGYVVFN